jgi:hypothetical protein
MFLEILVPRPYYQRAPCMRSLMQVPGLGFVIQEWAYYNQLTDADDDVPARIMELTGAISRYNPRILPSPAIAVEGGAFAAFLLMCPVLAAL